jgi:proteic killer suppression protein
VTAGFFLWKREVVEHGLEVVRKIPGYHDEPLGGKLKGLVRSVRLGSGYRLFYTMKESGATLVVEEINKHDYKAIERLFRR